MIAALRVMLCELVAHHVDNFRRNHARLDDIFCRAELRRFCFFGFIALISEYDLERTFREMFIRKHLEKSKAVELGHREVEEDNVGFESVPQARKRFICRQARFDGIAVLGKLHPVHVQEELIVVDKKNSALLCGGSLRCCICLVHTIAAGGSSSSGTSAVAATGTSGSWSPASKSVLRPLTSENGTCLSNALIIASSCIVSMPSLRAAAQSFESTGLSRTIFSMVDDISSTSKTAMRPRSPVGQVGRRFGSYTVSGILKRYFSGNDSSCCSMPLRCDAPSGTSLSAPGQKVRTNRCAIERMRTGGIRYGSTPMSMRRGMVPTASLV